MVGEDGDGPPRLAPGAEDLDAAFDGQLAGLLAMAGATGKADEVVKLPTRGAITAPLRPVIRQAIMTDSGMAVEPSYMEAFATSMPVSSQIMVWNSKMACSVPCEISA